jgi:threonine dehydratase
MARLGLTLDCVVVNASGGGLTAGIALAVKARAPAASIYTAEPAAFDDHIRSFRSGKRECNPALTGTICDALMAQSPGKLTFEINRVLVGHGVTATEEDGGAVGLAALLAGRLDVAGKTAVVVLSGGNVDPELFARLVA